jgi:hypothetical protein
MFSWAVTIVCRVCQKSAKRSKGDLSGQEFVKLLHELRGILERIKLLRSQGVRIEVHHIVANLTYVLQLFRQGGLINIQG